MPPDTPDQASTAFLTLLAVAVGALVANLYYAQPIVTAIAPEIGISPDVAGSITSVTQIGYGMGLFLLVSLADLVENRRLVLCLVSLTFLGVVAVASSTGAVTFYLASFLIGLCATGAQVLLPFAAQLVPEARRGRVIGNIMAGVLTGIMLARPIALFISASFGWRAVFWGSAVLLLLIGLALARMMPRSRPAGGLHYGQIIASTVGLFRSMPAVRWRAAYAALMFGTFNMFWTAAPLMLAEHFGLSGHGIGFFALAGAGGALAAPIAGRLADRDLENPSTAGAMVVVGLAFLATGWAVAAGSLAALVVFAVLIDAAIQTNQVVSRRTIFAVPAAVRGRVNAIYMTIQFAGGALGSVLGTVSYHAGGWSLTAAVGVAASLALLGLFALEMRGSPARRD
ncbi:MAG TPA: MFS transporter [Roseomonas sp.]